MVIPPQLCLTFNYEQSRPGDLDEQVPAFLVTPTSM